MEIQNVSVSIGIFFSSAALVLFQGDFSTSKLRMQEGTLQCKVACFQGRAELYTVIVVVSFVLEFIPAVLQR